MEFKDILCLQLIFNMYFILLMWTVPLKLMVQILSF